jgi:hypothetical protein
MDNYLERPAPYHYQYHHTDRRGHLDFYLIDLGWHQVDNYPGMTQSRLNPDHRDHQSDFCCYLLGRYFLS